jgi:hypothetical protein
MVLSQREIMLTMLRSLTPCNNFNSWENYVGKPIPVDSSSIERMKEMRAGRSKLCVYDQEMQDSTLVHFAAINNQPGGRLLGESRQLFVASA